MKYINFIISPKKNKMNKGKEEGMCMKNIIAVAAVITAVMAIVLIAFSSPAAASLIETRTFTPTGGNITYTGDFASEPRYEPAKNISLVYNWESGKKAGGEKIRFFNLTNDSFACVYVAGPYTNKGEQYSGYDLETEKVPAGGVWDAEGRKTSGYFMVRDDYDNGGWLQVVKHKFSVELGGEREKVQEGENFSLRLTSNNKKEKVMKLTIRDSEDYSIMNVNGTDIYEILVEYDNKTDFVGFAEGQGQEPVEGIEFTTEDNKVLLFDTSKLDMKEGKYEIILEDSATEAEDKEGITVEEIYLKVECGDVVKGRDIIIKITSSFYEEKVNVTVGNFYNKSLLSLDEEGKAKVKIPTENVDYGTYKITVEVCGMKETEYVTIKKGEASLEVPENATVGDIVHIKGTSESGDFAVLLVDDVFKNKARISDKKFEWDWDTSGELDGYWEIEVFIVDESFSEELVSDAWQREHGVDASATIFLFLPTFSMTVPKNIAKGDDVVISGTVIGADHVCVIVINYRGEVVFPPGGTAGVVNASTTPVEDGKWAENISELDSGRYTVIALYEGRDGITDAIKDGKWVVGDESKTLEQRVAILLDAITTAGSDDLFEKADFSVSAPKVILKVPETVEIGDEITVKAETNIREGAKAFVSLSQNSSVLKKTFALVENGSVNASINTSGLLPGEYNVAVDISGRASDEKEIMLVEKKVQEGGNETMKQNESLTEPMSGTVEEGNESMGVGEGEINESYEEEEEERKMPLSVGDLHIAVVVAIFISFAARRRR